MVVKNRTSSRRVFRWQSNKTELIPIEIKNAEYAERLAIAAEELYLLTHRLHKNRSHSEIHPGETLKPNSVAKAAAYEGVHDGNQPIQKAA